jgi:hypothetical protein
VKRKGDKRDEYVRLVVADAQGGLVRFDRPHALCGVSAVGRLLHQRRRVRYTARRQREREKEKEKERERQRERDRDKDRENERD